MWKQVQNTWDKGLVSDINEIGTPSNVLTDCLNGTLLTYNGNEQSLQNDMGNYALKNGKLDSGYTPVGTASYGDILYIVSYNPMTNKVQIGSFPSPAETISANGEKEEELKSILNKVSSGKYLDLMQEQEMKVFYNSEQGDLKIYPGDEYALESIDEGQKYESLKFYIIDDDKNLHDISNDIIIDGESHCVTWRVPGYLAARWELPIIDSFTIRPKSIKPSTNNTYIADINYQIESSSDLIEKANKERDLYVNTNGTLLQSNNDVDRYESLTYHNIHGQSTLNANVADNTLTISAKPIIKWDKYSIEYDQFLSNLVIDLNNKFNKENTHIASEYYTYSINGNVATLNFNIDNPVVSNGDITLKIYALPIKEAAENKNYLISPNWVEVSKGNVYDGVGQQIIEIFLPKEENIYLLRFDLSDDVIEPVSTYKVIICSEIMNQFSRSEYDFFDEIPMDTWLSKLNDVTIDISDFKYETATNTNVIYDTEQSLADNLFYTIDSQSGVSAFFPEGSEHLTNVDVFKKGYYFDLTNCSFNLNCKQKYLYNFCEVSFSSDSKLTIEDAIYNDKPWELSLQSVANTEQTYTFDKLTVPAYVQVNWTNDNSVDASAINGEGVCDINSNPGLWLFVDMYGTTLDGDKTEFTVHPKVVNVCPLISGKKNEYNYYYMDVISPLMEQSARYKTAKGSIYIDINRTPIANVLRDAFITYNICAIPTVFAIRPSNNKPMYITTNYYESYFQVGAEAEAYVPGIMFLNEKGPVFIPYNSFNNINSDNGARDCIHHEGVDESNPWFDLSDNHINEVFAKYKKVKKQYDAWTAAAAISAFIPAVALMNPLTRLALSLYCWKKRVNRDYEVNWAFTGIRANIFDNIVSFMNNIVVNTKNISDLTEGYFLNKTAFSEIHNKPTFTMNVVSTATQIKVGDVDVLEFNPTNISVAKIDNFNNPILLQTNTNINVNIDINDLEPLIEFKSNEWPYRKSENDSEFEDLTDLQNRLDSINYCAQQQADSWKGSVFYKNVLSGHSIGFYPKDEKKSSKINSFVNIYLNGDFTTQQLELPINRIKVSGEIGQTHWVTCPQSTDLEDLQAGDLEVLEKKVAPLLKIYYGDTFVQISEYIDNEADNQET